MADYGDLLDNEEVMDALFAILTGSKAPKDIEKRLGKSIVSDNNFLNQPESSKKIENKKNTKTGNSK